MVAAAEQLVGDSLLLLQMIAAVVGAAVGAVHTSCFPLVQMLQGVFSFGCSSFSLVYPRLKLFVFKSGGLPGWVQGCALALRSIKSKSFLS